MLSRSCPSRRRLGQGGSALDGLAAQLRKLQRNLLPFLRMRQQVLAETLHTSGELGRIRGSGIDKPVTYVSTHLFCVP